MNSKLPKRGLRVVSRARLSNRPEREGPAARTPSAGSPPVASPSSGPPSLGSSGQVEGETRECGSPLEKWDRSARAGSGGMTRSRVSRAARWTAAFASAGRADHGLQIELFFDPMGGTGERSRENSPELPGSDSFSAVCPPPHPAVPPSLRSSRCFFERCRQQLAVWFVPVAPQAIAVPCALKPSVASSSVASSCVVKSSVGWGEQVVLWAGLLSVLAIAWLVA